MPSASSRAPVALAMFWLAWWGACMLIWLLLTTTWAGAEAVAGAGASAVAATAATIVRRQARMNFRPPLHVFRGAWMVPVQIAGQSWKSFALLLAHVSGRRRVRGTLRAVPFRHGGESPHDNARRSVATVGITMTPNAIVIGFDEERDEVLVHQLWADPRSVTRLLEGP
jgi:multisubunit Na+/H+ antiporter MnhE subunit